MIFHTKAQNNQSELCKKLKLFIESNIEELEKELVSDLSHIDPLAVNSNGLSIENITHVQSNQYQLNYRYDYNIYNGCADMDANDEFSGRLIFIIGDDGKIKFEYPVYEERSTCDEL